MQFSRMASEAPFDWNGLGKWLSFVAAAILILLAIPLIFDHATGAAAGWNIFLGLLLFGAVASGNGRAPTIAIVIAGLLSGRFIVAIHAGVGPTDVGVSFVLLALVGIAAWDLRKQKKSI